MQSTRTTNTIYMFVVLLTFGMAIIHGEPQPMAKPTLPGEFKSAEELSRYINHVIDYYTLSGRARYGKRGSIPFSESDTNDGWDTVRTILEIPQSSQRTKFEKRKQEENRFIRELENSNNKKHSSRIDVRPCHTLDIVERYYGDVQ
ncbi:uncharacterized protein LOC114872747 [Osmia bicornis bicornis]|uniref:uncharacterized protein LOC114872747 n=1 Tax=Osmia bicornis bicornis TaxID=1437191 RepID=UPI0010F4C5F6|nr:uncharacterized protein LOC114872747 [Osmia bicornis bicornis]XP_029036152.1 uncharacterized protein LOC114872747 [Osmia bicornis bicornis]